MRRIRIACGVCLLLCLFLVSACGPSRPQATGETRDLKDSAGATVAVPVRPQRIVSLSISADDMLFELVEPQRIAALTYLADDPGISNVAEKAHEVAGRVEANVESVLAFKPDLVLIPSWQPAALVESLWDVGLCVYVYDNGSNVEEIKRAIGVIADAVNEPARGQALCARMDNALEEVRARLGDLPESQKKTVVYLSETGGIGGVGSTFEDICRQAGVKSGMAALGLKQGETMSKEQFVRANPDLLLLPSWQKAAEDPVAFERQTMSDPSLQSVKAIREKQVFHLPDRYVYCTSQHIADAVRALAEAAYPERFAAAH